jgi:hypothetical protein
VKTSSATWRNRDVRNVKKPNVAAQNPVGTFGLVAPTHSFSVYPHFGLAGLAIRFVNLNRDELIRIPLRASYTGMTQLWLPRTVLEADFMVSMPKIKTHHWSGVTLSMKNMFGVVPGARYGWPKNILHWKGIQESIL